MVSAEEKLTSQRSRETHTDTLQIGAEALRLVEVQYSRTGVAGFDIPCWAKRWGFLCVESVSEKD